MEAAEKQQKVSVITLGCEKNTVDSEILMGGFKSRGMLLEDDAERSDVVVLNTCGFIDNAKQESINAILEAIELKKAGIIKKVIVSGCLSERYRSELQAEMPEVDAFFGTQDFDNVITSAVGSPDH
ncbi:MAG TPA: 30S ribosomal protein S12 methylthiotransferase RimO, partial [Candidatus Kapabacteria bacterium]|nr:30S ribosomal protein S12 methylthiotransferase RimO [Candidatus Kapabacteria bacterium]